MEKQIISFSANEQILKKTAGQDRFADDVVGYIEAHFDLGDNWSGYDSIRAVWFTAFAQISTVLDQDGVCLVPPEVCNRKEAVNVNLVGSIADGDELTDRLTTYSIVAFIFDGNARVDGSETAPITPSQFEQYVAIVEALVGSVKDIDHATLNADYTLTIYYSDGTSDTVGPIRGEQGPIGPTGNGIASIVKTGTSGTNPVVDTYTITYTNGQTTTFTVTNGVKGDTGNGIQSIYKTGTAGAVDTYTILYTDGNTTEFTVTNGEVTNAVLAAAIQQAKEDLLDQFAVKDTASGAIASFPDGADWPAKNVLADINPVQELNGYSNPWPAGGGKNKITITEYGGAGYNNASGTDLKRTTNVMAATQNGNTIQVDVEFGWQGRLFATQVLPAGTYHVHLETSDATARLTVYLTDAQLVTAGNPTSVFANYDGDFVSDGTNRIAVWIGASSSGVTTTVKNLQVESGSSFTSWAPYSNICPISGWTGANAFVRGINIWDEEWEIGLLSPSTGGNYPSNNNIRSVNYIPVLPSTNYYFNSPKSTGNGMFYYRSDKSFISNETISTARVFTTPSDCYFLRFDISSTYGTTYKHDISINYPSTDHNYHAYDGDNYAVSWQTEAGTVYGGTIDLSTGVLTVEMAAVSMTGGFTKHPLLEDTFYKNNAVSGATSGDCYSNMFKYANKALGSILEGEIILDTSYTRVGFCSSAFATEQAANDYLALNPLVLVYPLATPITYQLTPTEVDLLFRANNVWADTGDIEVTYVADTKLYIDKMTA